MSSHLERFAIKAVSEDLAVSSAAIAALRAEGPIGLQTLLNVHAETLKRLATNTSVVAMHAPGGELQRLKFALDSVGEQRDCHASRLYWFTDFEQAKVAAKASGKPILSLRLLGKLDEEFSCANSRFFRTTLYANADVSAYLRDHFVLHWKSVRPVPKVTIDFGDGRKLEGTITGNSIHYILDAEGRPIDALPGLYGPQAFLAGLKRAEDAVKQIVSRPAQERESFLKQHHNARLAAINAAWSADVAAISLSGESGLPAAPIPGTQTKRNTANQIIQTKNTFEMPTPAVAAMTPSLNRPRREADIDNTIWASIAARHRDSARLDDGSKALMRSKNPTASEAGRRAMTKMIVEDPLLRAMRMLERSIAEDTVRNEYLFHSMIHDWFANGPTPQDVEQLNARVYAELFLTPDSDPWLGLVPRDAYTALENDGLIQIVKR